MQEVKKLKVGYKHTRPTSKLKSKSQNHTHNSLNLQVWEWFARAKVLYKHNKDVKQTIEMSFPGQHDDIVANNLCPICPLFAALFLFR